MTEVYFKDIDNNIDTEHYYTKEKFQEVMEYMRKMKKSEMEEERTKTEESDEEEEEEMTGARGHGMTKRQERTSESGWTTTRPSRHMR
eukprot:2439426-Heterocapsa_arctica.AAC.1